MQKRPDPLRQEAALRRVFPANKIEKIVYYEQAVLSDSETYANIGYEMFVVTQDELFHLNLGKEYKEGLKGIPLEKIDLVTVLPDIAAFFEPSVAKYTMHVRVRISEELGMKGLLDFYTYFEDSQFFYFLQRTWLYKKKQQAFDALYIPQPIPSSKLSQLHSVNSAVSVFGSLKTKFLAQQPGFLPLHTPTAAQGPSVISQALILSRSKDPKAALQAFAESTGAGVGAGAGVGGVGVGAFGSTPGTTSAGAGAGAGAVAGANANANANARLMDPADTSISAVNARMELLLSKMQTLEEIVTCLCSPRQLVFQSLYLSQPEFLSRIFSDIVTCASHAQYYTSAAAYAQANAGLTTSQSIAALAKGATSTSTPSSSSTSTSSAPPSVGVGLGVVKEEDGDGKDANGSASSSTESSSPATIPTASSFTSEREVFDARDGHPVEEKARLEYLVTLLTTFNFALSGSHALGSKRFAIFTTGSKVKFADLLNTLTLVDPILLKSASNAHVHLEITRRHRMHASRTSYNTALRQQQLQAAGYDPIAVTAVKNNFANEDKINDDVFAQLKLTLFELDNQLVYLIYNLFDLAEHSRVCREGGLKLEAIIAHISQTPRFESDRIPAFVRRAASLLAQRQSPVVGYFAYVVLEVLNKFLARSSDLRVAVARSCSPYIQTDLARKETMERIVQSPHFFYQMCIGSLQTFLRHVTVDSNE